MCLHIMEFFPCFDLSYAGILYICIFYRFSTLTLKHRETHGCVVSTMATDALVLKHQAISIHNAD